MEPSDGCAAIGERIEFVCVTTTSGSLFWRRERTGDSDTFIARNGINYFPDHFTLNYDNSDSDRISSTFSVNSMTPEMVGDVYFCEVSGIPSTKATLTEKGRNHLTATIM